MTRTSSSSVQGSSNRDSKSNKDLNLHVFSDDEQDLEAVYRKLLKDSMLLSHINNKMSYKLKITESQNSSLTSKLGDARVKVSQLESRRTIFSDNLIDARSKNEQLTAQSEKAAKELETLSTELKMCKTEKGDLNGKLKMVPTELDSTKSTIKRMNNDSMTLDEILKSQKVTYLKQVQAANMKLLLPRTQVTLYLYEAPLYTTLIHANTAHANTMNKKNVLKPKFIHIWHLCEIKGHIQPHCKKLINLLRNQRRKKNYSPQQVKTKYIQVCKFDLRCNVVLIALSAQDLHVWYLDSDCSRHMTGDKSLFMSFESYNGGSVRFGNGSK